MSHIIRPKIFIKSLQIIDMVHEKITDAVEQLAMLASRRV